MPIFAFICDGCGVTSERLVRDREATSLPCPDCSGAAMKQEVYHIAFSGYGRVPIDQRQVRFGAFQEASAELAYQHDRAEQAAGQPLPSPPLWQMAKREARRLQKLGVKDSADLTR